MELLLHTAALHWGSGQSNSCNTLAICLGAVGSGVVWYGMVWCGVPKLMYHVAHMSQRTVIFFAVGRLQS